MNNSNGSMSSYSIPGGLCAGFANPANIVVENFAGEVLAHDGPDVVFTETDGAMDFRRI